jgi:DNA-binding CsgD family transcriptional regulator/tetratricopeptide (TPR) repeat protein
MAQPAEQLVGRTAELGSLDRALAELERGESAALELVGDPGSSASELERELPFGVFVDALDEYVQGLDPRRLDSLDDDALVELAHVLPSLPARGEGNGAPRPDERYRTHRAVRHLLERLAVPKPLVLQLDDLHWADSGSIELLGSLLRRPPRTAVLIALALRSRQVPERLSGALERADQAGILTRLELGPLSVDEARELLGTDVGGAVYEESGGNPFYLQQLARSPRDAAQAPSAGVSFAGVEVPRAVAAALSEELALLPDEARQALEGAAVAGDPFELELAAAAAGVPEASAMEALDELLQRDLVRHTDVPRRFRFRHPLVRRAVYEAAPGGWRIGAHERTAVALADPAPRQWSGRTTSSAPHRHGDLAAVAVLCEAGETAAQRAPATAARLFGAAVRLLPPANAEDLGKLLSAMAQAHFAAGEFYEAYAALLESIELAPADAIESRITLTAACAGLENLLGRHQEAHARLMSGLESLSDTSSPAAVALMRELAVDGFYRMEYGWMRDWARRALDAARPLGDRPLTASAAGILTLAGVFDGATREAESARSECAALVDAMTDDELALCLDFAVDTLAAASLYLDRFEEAGARSAQALDVARATGQGQVVQILFWSGTIRTLCGRLDGAAEVLDTAIEIARLSGHAEGQAWNLFSRSLVATAAGDVETALATAGEAMEALRGLEKSFPSLGAGLALASALLAAGEPARAVEELVTSAGGDELPLMPACWRPAGFELLTRLCLALGRRDEAAAAAARARALAQELGLRMPAAMADRAAAAVALDAGDSMSAAEQALASAARAKEVGAPVEAALARTLAGRALAQDGERDRAAAELERAAAEFEARGALGHRDAAERELGKLGRRKHRRTRPGKADGAGIESLTERELQVARLVVDRKTNSQIAAELFLSPKTVETHIRHLFHKLDVSSRVEVARAVERADRQGTRK